jgi:DNA end-binding protein Ku
MAARSVWKGYLKINLVSIPVKAYSAGASGADGVKLNQLHRDCNGRIQYKKICAVHGEEVAGDQIVSGYEHTKGQYVIIDTDELDKLRSEDDKAINVDTFISPDAIDPLYFNGKGWYLVPESPVGQKPYTILVEAMAEDGRYAVGQFVMHGKEQLVLLRPVGNVLAMMGLEYEFQVSKPAMFEGEAPKSAYTADELKLMKTLIEMGTAAKFDLGKYEDVYTKKLTQLIEAKVAGQEIVATPAQPHAQVADLMEALKQSVAQAQAKSGTKAAVVTTKPPKKMAPSKAPAAAAKTRKKKTS